MNSVLNLYILKAEIYEEYNEVESRMKMNNVYMNENNLCSSLDDIMVFINDRVKDRERRFKALLLTSRGDS